MGGIDFQTMPGQVREQTQGEEIANTISHGLGLLLALAGLPVLLLHAAHVGGAIDVAGAAVFGSSTILLYLASTLYHAMPQRIIKRWLRMMDHAAIYLLIAGTYTPIALGVLRGGWGWSLLGVIWGLALTGLVFKSMPGLRFSRFSTWMYVAMGWLVIIAVRPLWLHMAGAGLLWLFAGGLAYTVGVVFYALDDRLRYGHFIWHLFVLAGTACHFIAILLYAW